MLQTLLSLPEAVFLSWWRRKCSFFLFVFLDDGDKLELSIRNSGMCMKHKLSSVFCCSAYCERKTAVITGVFVKHTHSNFYFKSLKHFSTFSRCGYYLVCAQRSSKFQRHIVKCVIFFHLNLQTVKHALPPSPPCWFKVKRCAACPSGGFLTPLHIITYYCFFVIRLWIFEESSRCSWWRLKLITCYSSFLPLETWSQ